MRFLFFFVAGLTAAYNCLMARQHHVDDEQTQKIWHGCVDRWQAVDHTANGTEVAAGELKECGGRTWFSNLHSWHSIGDCLATCSPCLRLAIDQGADAVTCYERVRAPPANARCMLGYNPRPRTDMRLLLCNEPDSSGDSCHVNPFIEGGHYFDLAAPGQSSPTLGEVIDVGCSLQHGLCMNWPLNGMTPQYVPLGETETPGD